MESFIVCTVIQCQFEIMVSWSDIKNIVVGIMLVVKAYIIEVFT